MRGIAEAILAIDPTAQVSVNAEDLNKITWYDGNPNGITAEQITAKQAVLVIQAEADAAAEANRMASAKEKLEALGLTTEEVKTAFGI
jgi:predicted amidohydrolase YtcJ